MIELNKDSKIVKIVATAQAYHSNAFAYGVIYLPYDLYSLTSDFINNYSISIYELDGKHSETETEKLEIRIMSLEDIIKEKEFNDYSVNFSDSLEEHLSMDILDHIEENELDIELINISSLVKQVSKLREEYVDESKLNLSKDIELNAVEIDGKLQDIIIPAGTTVDLASKVNFECKIGLESVSQS